LGDIARDRGKGRGHLKGTFRKGEMIEEERQEREGGKKLKLNKIIDRRARRSKKKGGGKRRKRWSKPEGKTEGGGEGPRAAPREELAKSKFSVLGGSQHIWKGGKTDIL